MQNFSQRLAQAIAKSGKSKGALAESTGVALSTVSRWLGGTVPKARTLNRIADFLGVDAKWLLAGENYATELIENFGDPRVMAVLRPAVSAANFELGRDKRLKELLMESEETFNKRLSGLADQVRALEAKAESLSSVLSKKGVKDGISPEVPKKKSIELEELIYNVRDSLRRVLAEAVALRHFAEISPATLTILRQTED